MQIFSIRRLSRSLFILFMGLIWNTLASAAEETAEDKITRAMSAAPDRISADATIVDMDGTLLRAGNNGWTCMPGIALIPGDKHPMCNDAVWMEWLAAAKAGTDFSTDTIGFSYMLQGDAYVSNDSPAASDPNDGSMWIQEGPHLMILAPEGALDGLPSTPVAAGPYVMWGKTPMKHIMVPVPGFTKE